MSLLDNGLPNLGESGVPLALRTACNVTQIRCLLRQLRLGSRSYVGYTISVIGQTPIMSRAGSGNDLKKVELRTGSGVKRCVKRAYCAVNIFLLL